MNVDDICECCEFYFDDCDCAGDCRECGWCNEHCACD